MKKLADYLISTWYFQCVPWYIRGIIMLIGFGFTIKWILQYFKNKRIENNS